MYKIRSNLRENMKQAIYDTIYDLQNEGITFFTVRQLYYQLVSKHVVESSWDAYKNYDKFLVALRKADAWLDSLFVDPSKPRIELYSSSFWKGQKYFVEIWLEKQALQDFFLPFCKRYRINLIICKGYPSVTRLRDAKEARQVPKNVQYVILYFGDFDPSGMDIERHINEELKNYGITVERVALTSSQVKTYNLPSLLPKKSDTRYKDFVKKYGNIAVELDALHPKVLKQLIKASIMKYVAVDKMIEAEVQEAVEAQSNALVDQVLGSLRAKLLNEAKKKVKPLVQSYVSANMQALVSKLREGEDIDYSVSTSKVSHLIMYDLQEALKNIVKP
ncbi:MAG: hypothetical protein ACP5M7_09185 [Thermoproteota archaeon]